jgi:membrane-associated phospholipid phosphatase
MDLPHKRLVDIGLIQPISARLLWWWPAKMIGTTLGMTGFFVVYFQVLQHPLYPPTVMPLIAVDRLIGFWPGALPLYLSLWLYVSLPPALLIDRRELVSFALAAFGLSAIGLGIFLFWPTTILRPEIDWSPDSAFAFLKSVDASGNACPSLHVAFAVFSAVWLERLLRQMGATQFVRALNWLWCLGILYSTVATGQHVSLDVLAGAALGLGVAAAHLWWLGTSDAKSDHPNAAGHSPRASSRSAVVSARRCGPGRDRRVRAAAHRCHGRSRRRRRRSGARRCAHRTAGRPSAQ